MERIEMVLTADLKEWSRVKQAMIQFCEYHTLSDEVCLTLQLVGEEWFINIITHGFNHDKSGPIENPFIRLDVELSQSNEIMIRFEDNAIPFNPLTYANPDISLPAEERKIGGLGIYIMKSKMDHISYRRVNGHNQLSMFKRIQQQE